MKTTSLSFFLFLLLLSFANNAWAQPRAGITVNGQKLAPGYVLKVCRGNSVTYKSSALNANAVNWKFKNGNPSTYTGTDVTVFYDKAGTDSTIQTVTGSNNTTASTFIIVKVSEKDTALKAGFAFSPDNECGNIAVKFTSVSKGKGLSYFYDFGDGATVTTTALTASHAFTKAVGANGTQSYKVSLTITDENGCSDVFSDTVTVKKIPDATLASGDPSVDTTTFNGYPTFSKCDSLGTYEFRFKTASSTASFNTNYKITWGYGSPTDTVFKTWNTADVINHIYPIGNTTLTYEVTGQNGCIATKKYNVFLGSSPSGGLPYPGNTDYCTGTAVGFDFTGYEKNPPGTIYTFHVNDGSPDQVYTVPPDSVYHLFPKSSCGTTSDGYTNAFTAQMIIENPCFRRESPVFGIHVSGSPTAAIAIYPDTVACVNTTVSVYNASDHGGTVDTRGNCTQDFVVVWKVSPASGYTISGDPGSVGTNIKDWTKWTPGSYYLNLNFTVPGTYTVKMYVANKSNCSPIDSVERIICVRTKPVANFSLAAAPGCNSDTLLFNNMTAASGCSGNNYYWSVTNLDPENCSHNLYPQFVNGSNATTVSPEIWFKEPGLYKIQLTASANNSGYYYCYSDLYDTILIKGKPVVDISGINAAVCLNNAVSPSAAIQNCYSTPPLTYAWTFTGATTDSSNKASPGTIVFDKTGQQKIKLKVTDAYCGVVYDSATINVIARPVADAGPVKEFCNGTDISIGTASVNGYSYQWSPSFGLNNANIAQPAVTLINNNTKNDTVRYYLTVTVGGASDCTAMDSVDVIVKKAPDLLVSPQSAAICKGGSVTLNASGAETYSWSPAIGLNVTNGPTVLAKPDVTTAYVLNGALSNGCSTQKPVTVGVDNNPNADAGADKLTCSGTPVVIGSVPAGGYSYAWFPSTGLSSASAAQPTVTLTHTKPGNDNDTIVYHLTVSASGSANCSASDSVKVIVKKAPVLQFSPASPVVCYGDSINIAASGAETYTWFPATYLDKSFGSVVNTKPGETITYNVSGNLENGCLANKDITVTVNPVAKAFFDTVATNFCAPYNLKDVVKVTTYPDRNKEYKWYINGRLFATNTTGIPPDTSIQKPGNFLTLTLVTTSKFNCRSDSIGATFTSNLPADASFTKSIQQGCEPLVVRFNNSTPNTGAASFKWGFGDGQTSDLAQPDSIIFSTGPSSRDTVYYISLTTNNGCKTSVAKDSIKVLAKPSARLGVSNVLLCSGQAVTVSNTSLGSGLSFAWDFGDGTTYNTTSTAAFKHGYTTVDVDTFSIRLEAMNNCGTDINAIDVRVAPNTINAQINVSASGLFGCTPHIVIFSNNTQGASKFSWTFGDGSDTTIYINNPPTLSHTYYTPGDYTAALSLSNGGCTDTTIYQKITVYQKPSAVFATQTVPNNVFCFGDTVNAINYSQNADAYRWNFGDGSAVSGTVNTQHFYQNTGTYLLTLFADKINDFGIVCYDSVSKLIKIASKPLVKAKSSNNIDCFINYTTLAATGGTIYQWMPDYALEDASRASTKAYPDTTTTYHVSVTGASGCVVYDSVTVIVDFSGTSNTFQMPTAFTPNGDQLNDIFRLKYAGRVEKFELSVFDRWGVLLYTTKDPSDGWDGTLNGKPEPPGAYVYVMKITSQCSPTGSDQEFVKKGSIVLIR